MNMPIILSVEVVKAGVLLVTWKTGETYQVDISDTLKKGGGMSPLRNEKLFRQAFVGAWGHAVEWPGNLGIGSDTLLADAKAQAGEAFPTDAFNAWMVRNGLSLTTAAEALGMSRRMIAYYHIGSRPIPIYIGLACVGWEATRRQGRKTKRARAT